MIRQETQSEKRKFLESLESVRAQNNNKKILNIHADVEFWKPLLSTRSSRRTVPEEGDQNGVET